MIVRTCAGLIEDGMAHDRRRRGDLIIIFGRVSQAELASTVLYGFGSLNRRNTLGLPSNHLSLSPHPLRYFGGHTSRALSMSAYVSPDI